MIVCTHELANLAEGGFQKSKLAEEAILKLIAKRKRCSYEVDLTEGKNTDWDGKLGDDYVEVKFSAKTFKGEQRLSNFFETHYKSGSPSALLLTKASKYITITPGWSNKHAMLTGKVRIWNVADLIRASNVFEKVVFDYGELGFFIPNKCDLFPHDWVGDVFFDQAKVSYDISKWI
jgi:uncharacterized protein (DUF433 family)